MPRFEVNEEVILKERNIRACRGIIINIMNTHPGADNNYWPNIPYPIYNVHKRNNRGFRYALDNKDRCKYFPGFPLCRIYKLGEA